MPKLTTPPADFPRSIISDRSMEENLTGNWRSLRPVIDAARCTGCLICWKFCPEACVGLTDKVPAIGLSYCKGCGVCVAECPPKAIRFEDEAGI
jgi:2-oxoacid:acceptor oxidoreductase delta subunit (pyruvate/2-ketoisovalerate family)